MLPAKGAGGRALLALLCTTEVSEPGGRRHRESAPGGYFGAVWDRLRARPPATGPGGAVRTALTGRWRPNGRPDLRAVWQHAGMVRPGRPRSDALRLRAAGLGLDHGTVRLVRVPAAWPVLGAGLAGRLSRSVGAPVVHIGSTTVAGMWAKPVIDLAVGAPDDHRDPGMWERLGALGWIYRGDAGPDDGGHVFVLESRPARRVAHVHVVRHGGPAWHRYLRLAAVLAGVPAARDRYGAAKLVAATRAPDPRGYTDAKTPAVVALLGGGVRAGRHAGPRPPVAGPRGTTPLDGGERRPPGAGRPPVISPAAGPTRRLRPTPAPLPARRWR